MKTLETKELNNTFLITSIIEPEPRIMDRLQWKCLSMTHIWVLLLSPGSPVSLLSLYLRSVLGTTSKTAGAPPTAPRKYCRTKIIMAGPVEISMSECPPVSRGQLAVTELYCKVQLAVTQEFRACSP